MVSFSHLDPGTDEAQWRGDSRFEGLPPLDARIDRLVVLAAHPDDETLGAAGLMYAVGRHAGAVTVVVATDGEGSHPDSPTHSREYLADLRRVEVARAVAEVAPDAGIHFFGLPDGALRENLDALTTTLAGVVDGLGIAADSRALIVAPWSGDGHPDHRAAAEAAARVCAERAIAHLGYPIWLWHWGSPDDAPWTDALRLGLPPAAVIAKGRALAAHTSQVAPLSAARGDEPVIHEAMRAHFERTSEVFVRERLDSSARAGSMPATWFEDFYRRNDDPWGFETRWYERRKRSVLLSSLPQDRLGTVLELGCSTGLITKELATRAERVVALDPAPTALDAARARLGADARVEFILGRAPYEWPPGSYDTVVLSEVGYYLDADDLAQTIRLIARDLTADGCLVACHWRHPVPEYPRSGDAVHAALRAAPEWEATVRHEERDFVLEVFRRGPARSVAEQEGLA